MRLNPDGHLVLIYDNPPDQTLAPGLGDLIHVHGEGREIRLIVAAVEAVPGGYRLRCILEPE